MPSNTLHYLHPLLSTLLPEAGSGDHTGLAASLSLLRQPLLLTGGALLLATAWVLSAARHALLPSSAPRQQGWARGFTALILLAAAAIAYGGMRAGWLRWLLESAGL